MSEKQQGISSGSETKSSSEKESVLSVASYNVFLRPPLIHSYRTIFGIPLLFQRPDEKWQRLEGIKDAIAEYDIVGLQELFGSFSQRRKCLLETCSEKGLIYHHVSSQPPTPSLGAFWTYLRMLTSMSTWEEPKPALIDGGLAILSKYPLENKDELIYSHSHQSDSLASKGCLYAIAKHPAGDLHVFVTHLQAGFAQYRDVALTQLDELAAFIHRKTLGSTNPILVLGDFNIDARVPSEKQDMANFMQKTQLTDTLVCDPEKPRPSTSLNCGKCSIDYVLYRDPRDSLRLTDTQILPLESTDGLTYMQHLSDHCLMKVVFRTVDKLDVRPKDSKDIFVQELH
eukprot:TRINITY_DN18065_c0_g1_i1.p1 TRINITY_DN18065_c0_g1~~TRINITY_DN18065_c0_g1_i1.p1  ORF type:complete len:342 (-),score=84.06 TRINITY_DN18065_c0_g1_i1:172-1197(-)